jgi:hypothetical protein
MRLIRLHDQDLPKDTGQGLRAILGCATLRVKIRERHDQSEALLHQPEETASKREGANRHTACSAEKLASIVSSLGEISTEDLRLMLGTDVLQPLFCPLAPASPIADNAAKEEREGLLVNQIADQLSIGQVRARGNWCRSPEAFSMPQRLAVTIAMRK